MKLRQCHHHLNCKVCSFCHFKLLVKFVVSRTFVPFPLWLLCLEVPCGTENSYIPLVSFALLVKWNTEKKKEEKSWNRKCLPTFQLFQNKERSAAYCSRKYLTSTYSQVIPSSFYLLFIKFMALPKVGIARVEKVEWIQYMTIALNFFTDKA